MPPRPDPKLTALDRAGKRLEDAERQLDEARQTFYGAVRDALDSGVSISEIARRRGVSRQSIQKLVDRIGRSS